VESTQFVAIVWTATSRHAPNPGLADAVLAEGGESEHVGRGPEVFRPPLQVRQGHPLHEDRRAGRVHPSRLPADARPQRHGRVHQLAQLGVPDSASDVETLS
jgi:hypothetical protein